MQAGKADNRNPVHRMNSQRYAPDKPDECKHCYFWKGKRKGCSQKECYYLLQEEKQEPEAVPGKPSLRKSGGAGTCPECPYGKHSPCIGYCIKKIMQEMKEKKQAVRKEENGIAG